MTRHRKLRPPATVVSDMALLLPRAWLITLTLLVTGLIMNGVLR